MAGPLSGLRIIEMEGLGPGPFCGMMLADQGAEVLRISRKGAGAKLGREKGDVMARGRRVVRLDLKKPEAVEAVLALAEAADGLIEGFRPGVMERLGLGPDAMLARNPRLVYGRMTGWGQEGPLAHTAGHDINYIALTGALHAIGTAETPVVPLNLVGDFGGGGMMLAFGMVSALLNAARTGKGQVVDAAMTDGSAALMAIIHGFHAQGAWEDRRAANMLDGGAHFYGVYQCKDGKHLAVGSIEPQFYAILRDKLGLAGAGFDDQHDRAKWPALKEKVAAAIRTRTRDEWAAVFADTDACVAPVLSLEEAPSHPHNAARGTYVEVDGVVQPAPAPRFSATPAAVPKAAPGHGESDLAALRDWGLAAETVESLKAAGAA